MSQFLTSGHHIENFMADVSCIGKAWRLHSVSITRAYFFWPEWCLVTQSTVSVFDAL